MRWIGTWDSGTSYAVDDVVYYAPGTLSLQGASYIATSAHPAQDPAPVTNIGVGDFVEWAVSIGWAALDSVEVNGPVVVPVTVTANHTASVGELVLANTANGALTVTLPDAAEASGGQVSVKKTSAAYALTIASADGMMFDAVYVSAYVTDIGTSFTFVSDGTYWNVT